MEKYNRKEVDKRRTFGIISHTIMHICGKKEVFGVLGIVYAIIAIGFLGCVV